MINYILQVVFFQVLFLAIYDFFLSKETFFTKNRWYLLSTPILSFLIPFIKIPTFQKAVTNEFIIYLPEIVLSPEKVIQETIQQNNFEVSMNYINILFWVGSTIFLILFLVKLIKIINLVRKNKTIKKSGFSIILLPKQTIAFSFFNYIFLGKEISEPLKESIIQHELVHSQQKHSLDLLFFEFLKIIMWFNPMIWLYQKRIILVHEYITDRVATKTIPKENYMNTLLCNFFQVENIAFINQFYKNTLIKKRILMMKKTQSKKINQLKYLVLIPVLASMLFYTSCSENVSEEIRAKKGLQTYYIKMSDDMEIHASTKETFLDLYLGRKISKWKELTYDDLIIEEKIEYNIHIKEFGKKHNLTSILEYKLFKGENGRNIIGNIIQDPIKETDDIKVDEQTKTKDLSFMTIDKAPTFPGCESGDKKCFSKMVQKHFSKNFNTDLSNQLGIEAGKKRVFIGFKIDKDGNVIEIKARAPHLKIKEEVMRVMESLPKMVPGEHDGKRIGVKYSIPFTLIID